MTTKRKILLSAIIAAAVMIVAAAVIVALYMNSDSTSYNTLLSRGEKYLDSADYDNAVLYYQKAVDLDPENEEGYIGLANAYLGQGSDDSIMLAKSTLSTGYTRTSSLRIYNMLLKYFPDDEDDEELVEVDTKGESSGDLALNTELLDTIINDTYDDYRLSGLIGSESLSNGVYVVSLESLGLELRFYNTESNSHVIDPNTNKPYSNCKPNTAKVTSLNVLLGAASATYEELSMLGLSSLTLSEDDTYGWVVSFSYQECSIQFASDENGTISAGAENELIPPLTVAVTGSNVLTGRVLNATTGSGITGAELAFTSASSGRTATVTSETGGYYTAELDPGTYSVTVSCSGYITETFSATVNNSATTSQNFTISTTLAEDEIRIVLEWGSSPTDLDSYLYGTTDSGESVSTSYMHKTSTGASGTLAELDVDDVDGYGPETTTIYDPNGTYQFYVVDFTGSGTMSNSGATVKVYVGNNTPVTISICSGLENGWYVCNIDHGVVTVVNTSTSTASANPK